MLAYFFTPLDYSTFFFYQTRNTHHHKQLKRETTPYTKVKRGYAKRLSKSTLVSFFQPVEKRFCQASAAEEL